MMDDGVEAGLRAPARHEIGADLSAVSIDELNERIALMRAEIQRLEAEVRRKAASRDAAAAFFKG